MVAFLANVALPSPHGPTSGVVGRLQRPVGPVVAQDATCRGLVGSVARLLNRPSPSPHAPTWAILGPAADTVPLCQERDGSSSTCWRTGNRVCARPLGHACASLAQLLNTNRCSQFLAKPAHIGVPGRMLAKTTTRRKPLRAKDLGRLRTLAKAFVNGFGTRRSPVRIRPPRLELRRFDVRNVAKV